MFGQPQVNNRCDTAIDYKTMGSDRYIPIILAETQETCGKGVTIGNR